MWLLAGAIKWKRPSVTFRLLFQNPITYDHSHLLVAVLVTVQSVSYPPRSFNMPVYTTLPTGTSTLLEHTTLACSPPLHHPIVVVISNRTLTLMSVLLTHFHFKLCKGGHIKYTHFISTVDVFFTYTVKPVWPPKCSYKFFTLCVRE